MIDEAKKYLGNALAHSKNPVALISLGKDSLLLLYLLRELGASIPLIWFRDKAPQETFRVIKEWGLTLYSYPPAVRYKVENSVVSEYSIGDARLPVIRDISDEGQQVGTNTLAYFHYSFDTTFYGYKASDEISLVSRTFEPEFQLGPTRMVAPLYHFTDDEVLQMIEDFAIPYEPFNDDALDCSLPIVPIETFRQRFSL